MRESEGCGDTVRMDYWCDLLRGDRAEPVSSYSAALHRVDAARCLSDGVSDCLVLRVCASSCRVGWLRRALMVVVQSPRLHRDFFSCSVWHEKGEVEDESTGLEVARDCSSARGNPVGNGSLWSAGSCGDTVARIAEKGEGIHG